MKGKLTILVADDHAVTRAGLVSLLNAEDGFDVIGQVENGRDAISQALILRPKVIIMDLMMPLVDGVEATQRILEHQTDARILILTTFGDSDDIAHALDAGAAGALMKNTPIPVLLQAIRSIACGRSYVAPEILKMIELSPPLPELTRRQQEILDSVTRGLTNADMSIQFGISANGVKDHIKAILTKLGASSRAEAVALALRKHLLKI